MRVFNPRPTRGPDRLAPVVAGLITAVVGFMLAAAVVLAGLLVADLVAAATDERRVSTP